MGQGGAKDTVHRRTLKLILAAWVLVISAAPAQAERATPSGLPVPRYVTLKFDKVNARAGPGDDHRLLWVYRVRGLPVQVIAENSEWRRVCDPKGGLAWVHKRTTDGRQNVLRMQPGQVSLYKRPNTTAPLVAYLRPQALAALTKCDKGWCHLKVGGISGWTPATSVWGTDPKPQCR